MKVRHIVMLGFLVLIAIVLGSIKEAKYTKKLTCTTQSDFHGMDSAITLKIKVRNKQIKDINIIIDATVPQAYASQKQSLINTLGADGNMQVTNTTKGIRLKTDMKSDYFKSLGLNIDSSYSELKTALEFQGYTCT